MRSRAVRWTLLVVGGLFVVVALGVVIAGAFFGDALFRFALERIEGRTQLAVRFARADVRLLSGKVALEGLRVSRAAHPTSDLALTAARVELDFSPWSLLSSEPAFGRVTVRGLRGQVERKGPAVAGGRGFVVRTLVAEDTALTFIEHGRGTTKRWALALPTYGATDVHRDSLLWDVLLRSASRGTVDGHPFESSVAYQGDFATTTWKVHDVTAAEVLAAHAPALQVGGKCKLTVTHKWVVSAPGSASSTWGVACDGLHLGKALDAPGLRQLSAWLAEKPRDVQLDFPMALGEGHFAGGVRSLVKPMALAAGQGLVKAALQAAVERAFISAGSRLLDAARDITGKRKARAAALDAGLRPVDGGGARADGGVAAARRQGR